MENLLQLFVIYLSKTLEGQIDLQRARWRTWEEIVMIPPSYTFFQWVWCWIENGTTAGSCFAFLVIVVWIDVDSFNLIMICNFKCGDSPITSSAKRTDRLVLILCTRTSNQNSDQSILAWWRYQFILWLTGTIYFGITNKKQEWKHQDGDSDTRCLGVHFSE